MGGKLRLENLKLFEHLIDYQKIGKKAEAKENTKLADRGI
jgi:hypothetical protein